MILLSKDSSPNHQPESVVNKKVSPLTNGTVTVMSLILELIYTPKNYR